MHNRGVLEADDAGHGNVETDVQCLTGDVPVLGEAVHHAAGLFGTLLTQQADGVLGRRAGVDDQRLLRLAGGPDVNPETLTLPVQLVAGHAVVIQSGLADGNHFGLHGQLHQLRHRGLVHVEVVGMHPHRRRQQAGMGPDEVTDPGPCLQRDRHAQRMFDPFCSHGGQNVRQAFLEFGKVQMAVGVDEHAARSDRVRGWGRF